MDENNWPTRAACHLPLAHPPTLSTARRIHGQKSGIKGPGGPRVYSDPGLA